jgi:hypothetical protein
MCTLLPTIRKSILEASRTAGCGPFLDCWRTIGRRRVGVLPGNGHDQLSLPGKTVQQY